MSSIALSRSSADQEFFRIHLELAEKLHSLSASGGVIDGNNVELDGLGEGAALSNSDLISLTHAEARRAVSRESAVTLLITLVLADVVQIIAADNDGALHLVSANDT